MTDEPQYMDFDPDSNDIINRVVVDHAAPSTDRSVARRVALQALYEIDAAGHAPGDVLQYMITDDEEVRKVRSYIRRLVTGILGHRDELDRVLQMYAPEFPLQQVAVIDRNVLRIALYEMAVGTRTPIGVAIDEAVELAKLFGADGSARFVNGVLGTIALNIDALREQLRSDDLSDDFDDFADEDNIIDEAEPETEPPSPLD